ncbi:MAG: undecaprenyl-phosphate glucose phosphotransferase [Ignavibacteriae bacterium]|nr:undecaprenyl-phosphate glucose phosphotransferase [Ignavibacteriota bacterium]
MDKKTSKIEILIPLFTIISDSLSVISAFIFSYWLRFYSPFQYLFPVEKGIPQIEVYLFFILATIPVWILTFQGYKMYRLNRVVFIFDEFFIILKCVTIGILVSLGILFFFRDFPYSRIVFFLIWASSVIFVTIGRYILLKIEKTLYNNNIGVKKTAVVGVNEMSDKVYKRIQKDKYTGFDVLGYFAGDDAYTPYDKGKTFLGTYNDLPEKIRELGIQKLFVSLPSDEHKDLALMLKLCEGINVEFLIIPDYTGVITSRLKLIEIDGIPFMRIKALPFNIWDRMVKRVFDVIFSLVFMFLFSPFFVIIALLVKFTSPGPLFYKQERVGIDGIKFMILKFRSMKPDAEPNGPQFAKKNDNRYTNIGKFLRRYSLDEIPQFINVLKGEMSIVGPRPEREYFINIMKKSVSKYLERHRVKCGVTGWAQVNGLRGPESPIQPRIDYDIYYIENWSLVFDMKIIAKTVKEMFLSESAF